MATRLRRVGLEQYILESFLIRRAAMPGPSIGAESLESWQCPARATENGGHVGSGRAARGIVAT